MKILSYCLMLFFAVVMVACTGTDTETIVKQTQCHDDTIVTGDETCPEPVVTPPPQGPPGPPSQGTTPNDDDEDTNRGDTRCTTQVKGTKTFTGSSGDDKICGDDTKNTIMGGDGRDTIRGGKGDDVIHGGLEDDKLYGEAGDDELFGDGGRDLLDGGPGNDELTGGEGEDEFVGGLGNDTVKYAGSKDGGTTGTSLTINLADRFSVDEWEDQDEYKEIENIEIAGVAGTTYTITGDGQANCITGGAGTFTIDAGTGNDVVNISTATAGTAVDGGEGGIDTLIVDEETTINTSPYTGFENLRATEDSSAIPLIGDNGPNKLIGGPGATTFTGNGGADTFVIKKGEGNDIIADFSIEQKDKVYLCGFSGTSKKTAKEGELNTVQIDGGQEIVFTEGTGFESFTVPVEPEEPAADADDAARTAYKEAVAARNIQINNAAAVIKNIFNRSGSNCE